MSLPIIFIHTGYSAYLEFTLRQARMACPHSEIILLGDDANDRFDFITHVHIADFSESARAFAGVYRHCSTNPYEYEIFCFQRWFVLEEYLRKTGKYQECFVCDSDVLLYSDVDAMAREHWREQDLGLIIFSPEVYSIGISFWRLPHLAEFCRFTTEQYVRPECFAKITERWEGIKASGQPGSYCDMCATEAFCHSRPDLRIFNLTEAVRQTTFDFHVNIPECWEQDHYRFRWGRKRFLWRDGIPYGYHLGRQEYVRFHCIHFQGPAKFLTAFFYTGPGFPGRLKLSLKFFALNTMAFWYKTLKIRYRFAFLFNLLFAWRQARKEKRGK